MVAPLKSLFFKNFLVAGKSEKEKQFEFVLSEELKALRESLKLNLTEMGIKSEMSRQQYEKFERLERTPTLYSLYRIFSGIGADPGEFIRKTFRKFDEVNRPRQILSDVSAAKEYYMNAKMKKAKAEDENR